MTEMKVNQSPFERFARIIIGGLLLVLATYVPMSAALSWILVVAGVILMLTGLAGYCPIYATLGINTNK